MVRMRGLESGRRRCRGALVTYRGPCGEARAVRSESSEGTRAPPEHRRKRPIWQGVPMGWDSACRRRERRGANRKTSHPGTAEDEGEPGLPPGNRRPGSHRHRCRKPRHRGRTAGRANLPATRRRLPAIHGSTPTQPPGRGAGRRAEGRPGIRRRAFAMFGARDKRKLSALKDIRTGRAGQAALPALQRLRGVRSLSKSHRVNRSDSEA